MPTCSANWLAISDLVNDLLAAAALAMGESSFRKGLWRVKCAGRVARVSDGHCRGATARAMFSLENTGVFRGGHRTRAPGTRGLSIRTVHAENSRKPMLFNGCFYKIPDF